MKIEIRALVKKVKTTEIFESGFQKRGLILDLDPDGKYENQIEVTFVKDAVDKLDGIMQDDEVVVEAFLQGRSYLKQGDAETNRRWFNEIRGWKIDVLNTSKDAEIKAQAEADRAAFDETGDDLPF